MIDYAGVMRAALETDHLVHKARLADVYFASQIRYSSYRKHTPKKKYRASSN